MTYRTNPAFYRATRSVAFNLDLSWAQVEMLVQVDRIRQKMNVQRDIEIERDPKLVANNPHWYHQWPEYHDGDGKDFNDWGLALATRRCLVDKGLITGFNGRPTLTKAGWLTLQLLGCSGHLMEIDDAKQAYTKAVTA